MMRVPRGALAALLVLCAGGAFGQSGVTVGSKRFTESYILGEILTRTAAPHAAATHRQGLGNTRSCSRP